MPSSSLILVHNDLWSFRREHLLEWMAQDKASHHDDLWEPEYLPGEGEEDNSYPRDEDLAR